MKLKEYACTTAALMPLSLLFASGAAAQTANSARSDVEEVVVYGIRKSMESSLIQKRDNTSQIDVITAEDVTKFPDVNVAESLSYTWRSRYINGYSASGTYGGYSSENLTNYTDDWGQLDGQISYDLMAGRMQATLSAQNILDKVVEPYTTGALPLGWSKFGTRVSLGLTYKLE